MMRPIAILAVFAFVGSVTEQTKDESRPGEVRKFEIAPDVFMEFCWIPPGEAQLGSPKPERDEVIKENTEPESLSSEAETRRPKFKTQGFWLGKYTVTQKEWEAVMGNNPSYFQQSGGGKDRLGGISDTSRFPVEEVSWEDCQKFLKQINYNAGDIDKIVAFGNKDVRFVLPHEDQWEYACRGGLGNVRAFYWGDELNGTQANCDGRYPYGTDTQGRDLERTCAVDFTNGGKYEKHPWGLYHMSGNVYQWCENKYDSEGSGRVIRGGGWFSIARYCRSALRSRDSPGYRDRDLGFRVAIVPSGP